MMNKVLLPQGQVEEELSELLAEVRTLNTRLAILESRIFELEEMKRSYMLSNEKFGVTVRKRR